MTFLGILTIAASGLLITGATAALNRRTPLLLAGDGLSIAISLYFVFRLMNIAYGTAVWVPVTYAVLPIISLALLGGRDVRAWARAQTYDQE